MGEWFSTTVLQGSLLLAVPVALLAGAVSFFSPCVVPLLPGYVSYMTGLSGADLESARGHRRRLLAGSVLFVLGFSLVFLTMGLVFGALGDWFSAYQDPLTRGMGVVTIVLGLAFMGLVPFLQRDVRVHQVPAVGVAAAPLLGILFGLGWTPCIGPTLSAVLSLSLTESSAMRGTLLAFAYSLGLGLPFVLAALAFRRMLRAVSWVRRHQVWVTRLGGAMLVVVGLLLVSGLWDLLVADMRGWVSGFETVV
ncbi:MAG: cytochrome c biogenesis protein CcdA [Actinomycetota bacterium]|nr:cytochrome c biogenesis protein CcdA [Actinomycetota bacterium]